MKCKAFSVSFVNNPEPLEKTMSEWIKEEKITSNFIPVPSKQVFDGGDDTLVPVQNITVVIFYKSKRKSTKKSEA